jgi:predicted DCC family thiol-disulfide oxidoreductase YuxK
MDSSLEPTAAASREAFTTEAHPLLLFYDGDCSFCARWVARVMRADTMHRTRIAQRQGRTFQRVGAVFPEGVKAESVVLVKRRPDGHEDFFIRSTAIRKLIDGLPSFRFFALVLHVVPTPLSDLGYIIIAHLRGVLFGRWAGCRPDLMENRELFLD